MQYQLNSIRNGRLELEDPDEILSSEFPINEMNLTGKDGFNPAIMQSLKSVNILLYYYLGPT